MVASVAVTLVLPSAAACFAFVGQVTTPGVDAVDVDGKTIYTYYYRGLEGTWVESNDWTVAGVRNHVNPSDGTTHDTEPTGLQMHDVCYGTFTLKQATEWNWDHSGGAYGHPSGADPSHNHFDYIPFSEAGAEHFPAYQGIETFDARTCEDPDGLDGTYVPADRPLR